MVQVKKSPSELVFDSASTLYIGQAGPLLKGAFNVRLKKKLVLLKLKIFEYKINCLGKY